MSARTVAAKDFRSVTRSRGLWAVATLLALLFAAVAFGYQGYRLSAAEQFAQLFRMLSMVLAVLLPLVALLIGYMAIAGERESGGIKFLLGFPNTRRDVFVGKLASRLAVVAGVVSFAFVAAASVAAARHGVLLAGLVVGLFLLSLVYGAAFVGVAVALSGAVAAKSRAIAAAVGSYFVLVLLFLVPGIRLTAVVRWFHTSILGAAENQNLYDAVSYLSPVVAYQKATNLVFPAQQRQEVFRRPQDVDLPGYLGDEVSLAIFAAWLVVPLVVGYLRFDRADLE